MGLWYSLPIQKTTRGKRNGGDTISVRSQSVIDALPRIHLNRIERAVQRATAAMLKMQDPAGYWWAELESNVTITAEYIMLHRFLGLDESKVPRMAADILDKQLPNGGWSIWRGDGGEISTTVEAYLALKIAGLSAEDPRLLKAREFVLSRGGRSQDPGLYPHLSGPVRPGQLGRHPAAAGGVHAAAPLVRAEHL